LPPLKERREDIPDLATHFLAKSARELGGETKQLTPAAMSYLTTLSFPGNVRQLENLCHWLTVMAPGQVVDLNDLPPELRQEAAAVAVTPAVPAATGATVIPAVPTVQASVSNAPAPWTEQLARTVDVLLLTADPSRPGGSEVHARLMQSFERTLIERALRRTGGRRIEAAQLLGIGRNTITRKIQELGLDEDVPAKFPATAD
jgi:two-component system nitrogen regulation response regulator GlnG